jgi:hypothetical protein
VQIDARSKHVESVGKIHSENSQIAKAVG